MASDRKGSGCGGVLFLILVVGVIGLAIAIGSNKKDPAVVSPPPATATRPGSAEVYARIDAMTACPELQAEFTAAMANVDRYPAGAPERTVPLAYAGHVADRQLALGC